ncbi:MAG: AAA family ATPase, partial [Gammaproteobacteria bacterium]|nr:AAA family ATPase [Gammaproteobacteria bacterium]
EVTLTSIPADQMQSKQSVRHQAIATIFVEKYGNNMNDTIAISNSKKSAENLNHAIRETLLEKNKIGHDQYIIKTVEPVFLTTEKQKHARFYPENALIKTHVSRGIFRTHKIIGHDTIHNKIILQSELGRRNLVSPDKIANTIQNGTTNLYLEKNMAISQGDAICVTQSNKQAKLLNLKVGESYSVAAIDRRYVALQSLTSTKLTKTKIDQLNGLALNYNYAISANESFTNLGNKKEIICDLPAHAINANLLADISKHADKIHIITDNAIVAEKKIRTSVVKQHAIDQEKIAPSVPKFPARLAIDYAISVVGSREAAFSLESLIEKALSYKLADNRLSDLHTEIRDLIKENALHCRTDKHNNVVLATHETVITEQKIISQIASGKNQYEPLVPADETRALLKTTSLTPGQKNACELIASTKDRFVMIQGYAGTGKSTMLQTLIGNKTIDAITGILPKDTLVTALAPTHQAVSELKKRDIEAQTLKSFLIDNQNIDAESSTSKNKLIIVDESSMISNSDFHELQAIVEKQNARCVYLGDIAQLSAVEAGKPSELAYFSKEASIATATMHENQRQKNPDLKKIVQLLMSGGGNNFSTAFKLLDQQNKIVEIKDQETTPIAALATAYTQLDSDERSQTLIAAATNKNRIDINTEIHDQLKKQGELSGSTINFNILEDSRLTKTELLAAHNHKPGMVIKYQNEYMTVTHVDEKNKMLTLKDDKNNISFLLLHHLPKNNFIEQYTTRNIDINIGEKIKFTKTNRDLDRLANTPLIVESIDHEKNLIKAKSSDGKEHVIDIHNRENQHIDYAYCSTTHGLQGATSKNIIVYLDSHNRFSNTMRQMYVAVTRAQENAVIFTDDRDRIKQQVINHRGEKTSALEAMELINERQITAIFAAKIKSEEKVF